MPDSAQRKPWIMRSLSASAPMDWGLSTLRSNVAVLRGSRPCPMACLRTWYSSSPSCRFSSCEEIATGASESSSVTSNVMIARCRLDIETIRVESTCTSLPAGVRQTSDRLSRPVRKSSVRS